MGLAGLKVPTLSSISKNSGLPSRFTLTTCGPCSCTPASFLPTPVKNAGPMGSTCSSGLSWYSPLVRLLVHFAPPWQLAQKLVNSPRPPGSRAASMGGMMGARTVATHSLIASSESLMPLVGPWLNTCVVLSTPFTLVAKPLPPWMARALLLKSVFEPRTALQLRMRWSSRLLRAKVPSSGIVWRGPVSKIQVTLSAWPSSWQEAQLDQAPREALPLFATGSMSRSAMSNCPSPLVSITSGMPSAVKNASLPTRLRCACVPGAGGALDSMSRASTVLVFEIERRHRRAQLVVGVGALGVARHHHAAGQVARLQAPRMFVGIERGQLAVDADGGADHVVAPAADDQKILAAAIRVDRDDVVEEQLVQRIGRSVRHFRVRRRY